MTSAAVAAETKEIGSERTAFTTPPLFQEKFAEGSAHHSVAVEIVVLQAVVEAFGARRVHHQCQRKLLAMARAL
jgi:hypothetical protein